MRTSIRFLQGRWHRWFGHPSDLVKMTRSHHYEGGHKAAFYCLGCRRNFVKVV